jgi:hypothetical protein
MKGSGGIKTPENITFYTHTCTKGVKNAKYMIENWCIF